MSKQSPKPPMTLAVSPAAVSRPTAGRGLLHRLVRMLQTLLGCLIIVAGVIIAPLPGPMGLPVVLLGLVMVLRNAYWARKAFIRAQRAHPNVLFPIRRLLRRDPQFAPVVWQQLLRLERLIVPRRWRSIGRWRRTMRRE